MKDDNWFEKHSGLTISCLLLVAIIILTFATEKILGYRHEYSMFNFALPDRAIRLREFPPMMEDSSFPAPPEGSEIYDTLVMKKYTLRTDKNGFIIPSERYSHPDISLAFVGGSTTVCHCVDEDLRFPYLAGVLLEKNLGIKINSYNAARTGNDSLHTINILVNKIIPLNPKIVLMMHNINDLTILLYERSYWNNNSSRSTLIDINKELTLKNYLRITRDRIIPNISTQIRIMSNHIKELLRAKHDDEFADIRGKAITINKAEIIGQFEMNLQTFISICQARKIVPVLMTMPSRLTEHPDQLISLLFKRVQTSVSYQDFKSLFDAFNDSIRKKAKENHILLIDLAREIPQEKEYMYDTVHYTEYGSVKIAHLVSEQLQPIVKSLLLNDGKLR